MSNRMLISIYFAGVGALAVLGFVWMFAVWRECLIGNPWWYCLAIIGR